MSGCQPAESAKLADLHARLFAAGFNGRHSGKVSRQIIRWEILNRHFDQAHERAFKIRFCIAAAIDNHADCGDDAAMRVHDIDCLLHASAAGDDVFDQNEFLVRQTPHLRRERKW